MLFNLHIFVNYPGFILLFIFIFTSVARKYTQYDFNSFAFANICFVTYNMIYSENCSVHTQEKCVILDGKFYLLGPFGLKYDISPVFFC